MACIAYVLLFAGTMIVTVAARIAGNVAVMDAAHVVFSLAACCTPLVFLLHGAAMITAPLVARHARAQLWPRWWTTLIVGVAVWCGAAVVFLALLSALML